MMSNNGFGIQSIDMGVLGGIISGIIIAKLHQRFYNIQLPDALSFSQAHASVPIITTMP